MPLTLIAQTTGNNNLSIKAYKNKTYQDTPSDTNSDDSNIDSDRDIKNLSTIVKVAKSKMSNLAQSKKSELTKAKKLEFTKVIFSKTDFLTFEAKKSSYTYKRLLLNYQFFSILIRSTIFILKLMF